MIEIRHYVSRAGKDVFDNWLTQLGDARAQAKIANRINRLAAGNFGDCKSLQGGLFELRIDWGLGYRVYYAMIAREMRAVALWWGQAEAASGYRASARIPEGFQRQEQETMKRKLTTSHDEAIVRRLRKDSAFAAEYLRTTLEDEDDPRVLLIALRHLVQAEGIAKVAKVAGVERESLYRALSHRGNPRLSTLIAVTKAIGLRLTVEAA